MKLLQSFEDLVFFELIGLEDRCPFLIFHDLVLPPVARLNLKGIETRDLSFLEQLLANPQAILLGWERRVDQNHALTSKTILPQE
jgi:hypothetical protein